MKGAIRCLFTLEQTTDCRDNITVILFSDMFTSFNISKEKSCSLNVQRLLFLFTTLAGKIFVFPQMRIYERCITLRENSYCFSLDLCFLTETDCVLCELGKGFLHNKQKNSGGNLVNCMPGYVTHLFLSLFLCLFLSLFLSFSLS